jgi:hypothetical protein
VLPGNRNRCRSITEPRRNPIGKEKEDGRFGVRFGVRSLRTLVQNVASRCNAAADKLKKTNTGADQCDVVQPAGTVLKSGASATFACCSQSFLTMPAAGSVFRRPQHRLYGRDGSRIALSPADLQMDADCNVLLDAIKCRWIGHGQLFVSYPR